MWLRLAGGCGRPRVRDVGDARFRGLGTPRRWFVARRLSKVERAAGWAVLGRHLAELLCASRDARVASPAATGCCGRGGEGGCVCEGVARREGWRRKRIGWGSPGGDLSAVGGEFAGPPTRASDRGPLPTVAEANAA